MVEADERRMRELPASGTISLYEQAREWFMPPRRPSSPRHAKCIETQASGLRC